MPKEAIRKLLFENVAADVPESGAEEVWIECRKKAQVQTMSKHKKAGWNGSFSQLFWDYTV